MPSLSLWVLSDQIYERLRQLANRIHRSMEEQVRLLNQRDVCYAKVGALERAGHLRSVLVVRHFPDLAAVIQADQSH